MTERVPTRTARGRDVLLDRTIELDAKLRTVLAQCDGKRDPEQIKARFGSIVDVDAALAALRELGLIEDCAATAATAPAAAHPPSVLEAALGAVTRTASIAEPAATAEVIPVAPLPASPPPASPAPAASTSTAAEPEPVASEDDPYAEWFPPSMRRPNGPRAA